MASRLFAIAALLVGGFATYERDLTLLVIAGLLLFSCAIMTLVQLVEGNRTNCAVCRAALFGSFRHRKHREARKLVGSYALPIACDVLISGRYQCPNCNERVICRGEENELEPKHEKPITATDQSFPTMRQSAIAAMRRQSLENSQGIQSRESVTKPDDSPTLPA